jgi:hypothetical protein
MNKMIAIALSALSALFASSVALAQGHPANFARPVDFPAKAVEPAKADDAGKLAASNCEAQAVSKDGKPLPADAKTAFMKKCMTDAKAGK